MANISNAATSIRKCTAMVVGAGGQDGTILCAELKADGCNVIRIERSGIREADGSLSTFDIKDTDAVYDLIARRPPDEIYYLAAHHHSSDEPTGELGPLLNHSFAVHCQGLIHMLDAIVRTKSKSRLFYASSSLVFGNPLSSPQNEETPILPVCAYGITKAAGMGICDLYRRERDLFCCSGILFNHESIYRAPRFVSKKIVSAVVDIHLGTRSELLLGSLDAKVDWGAATDFVRAMRAILALETPQDFVVSTGIIHSVRDFVSEAFSALNLDYAKYVKLNPEVMLRPPRTVPLVGDPSKLKRETGWAPRKSFRDLIHDIVHLELASRTAQ